MARRKKASNASVWQPTEGSDIVRVLIRKQQARMTAQHVGGDPCRARVARNSWETHPVQDACISDAPKRSVRCELHVAIGPRKSRGDYLLRSSRVHVPWLRQVVRRSAGVWVDVRGDPASLT